MTRRRVLCRAEFERLFLSLYPALIATAKRYGYAEDTVHIVFVAVLETKAYQDLGRGKHRVMTWLMGKVKQAGREQQRKERRHYGSRRINERD